MTNQDARLWELVESTARSVTDQDTGRFTEGDFIDALRARLAEDDLEDHVRSAGLEHLARNLAQSFVRTRSPKPGKPQEMFNPWAVLKLGKGLRVWMERATPADLIQWGRLSSKNAEKVAAANAGRQQYVADRLEAFLLHQGWQLGRLERAVFGYVETDEPPTYSDPDVDDEDDLDV